VSAVLCDLLGGTEDEGYECDGSDVCCEPGGDGDTDTDTDSDSDIDTDTDR
jgi:hypothetical protein